MAEKKIDITKQVDEEHQCIKRDLDRLKDSVMKEVSAEEFSEWKLELKLRVHDLRSHIEKHFDLEEAGGFREEIRVVAPESMKEFDRLEGEHDSIIADLDQILADVKKIANQNDEIIKDIQNQVKQFVSRLRAHEGAENVLIQMVYSQDIGYPSA